MAALLVQTVNPAVSTGTITATPTNTLVGSLILVFVGASASIHAVEDQVVTTAGAQTGTMTAGGTLPLWDAGVATFVVAQGKGDSGANYNSPRHIIVGDVIAGGGAMSRSEVAN